MARNFKELRDKMSPERRARVDARVKATIAEMPLHHLRKARELTQATVAELMQISQGDVSKLEQRTDCYVSTLRKYLAAMGGDLDIVASFPDGTFVRIQQLGDLAEEKPAERDRRSTPRRRTDRPAAARA